jgi:DNA-directed RNA polymerase beta' subunit
VTCITTRTEGKSGIIQSHVVGKRVDHSGRNVIDAGGPYLRVDEFGIPRVISENMYVQRFVNKRNLIYFQEMVDKGRIKDIIRQGANIDIGISTQASGQQFTLRLGDIVNRPLEDGDAVVINRQPTLRKESKFACKLKIMPYKYGPFRLPLALTRGLNADQHKHH